MMSDAFPRAMRWAGVVLSRFAFPAGRNPSSCDQAAISAEIPAKAGIQYSAAIPVITGSPLARGFRAYASMPRSETFARSPTQTCLALLACMALAGQSWAAGCQGAVGPETAIVGRTGYDPFNPADIADSYRISIANTGAAACVYGVVFRARDAHQRLGGTLAYGLTDMNGLALIADAPGAGAPLARLRVSLEPSAYGQIAFQVAIPRGQFAAPGIYRDTLDLELHALDANGRIQGAPLQTTALAIAYTVPRVMSVNIRGGELATTLSFGTLAKGQQRVVEIQARSNEGYQLDVTSDNHGALGLTPKPPGRDWSVPYMATLGGRPLHLAGGTSLRSLPPTRPESDAGYPLAVTIGEVGQKRAGRYEDVITIEIRAAIP